MKKPSTVALLVWFFWALPWGLEGLLGEGSVYHFVRLTCAVIVALLIPIVVLQLLTKDADEVRRGTKFWIGFFVSIPLVFKLAVYTFIGADFVYEKQVAGYLTNLPEADGSSLAGYAISEELPEARKLSAGLHFLINGTRTLWKNPDGEMEIYEPSYEEELERRSLVGYDPKMIEVLSRLSADWRETKLLLALNLGSFMLILFLGLARWAFFVPGEKRPEC